MRSTKFLMATKNTGTRKIARMVPVIMPPATPVPIAFWLAEPGPVLTTSGSTPRTKAIEVMRIGRNRSFTELRIASIRPLPWRWSSSANSMMRMAFLVDSPTVVSRPTLKYTSFGSSRKVTAASAPRIPNGTTRITATGIVQLS